MPTTLKSPKEMIYPHLMNANQTLLCVGPMSRHCIDASLELSAQYQLPLILIASRRQVDASCFGGGYVENFTTGAFAKYVHSFPKANVFLARDHGGPWQSSFEQEKQMDLFQAMASAKKSFEEDILSGFDFIHIDPSIPINGEDLTLDKILSRLFELLTHCHEFALSVEANVEFELGTEEQNGYFQDLEQFEYFLEKTLGFCQKNRIKIPTFVVAQTGTKVLEMQNIGAFQRETADKEFAQNHLRKSLELCKKYGVFLKEHNTDYLSCDALALRPFLGIHASNVAPEFGVFETRSLLYLLGLCQMKKERQEFISLALESKKWVKWMLPNSKASDLDKASICGHYIFSHPQVCEMKEKLRQEMLKKNISLDSFLKKSVKGAIMRYLHAFNLLDSSLKSTQVHVF